MIHFWCTPQYTTENKGETNALMCKEFVLNTNTCIIMKNETLTKRWVKKRAGRGVIMRKVAYIYDIITREKVRGVRRDQFRDQKGKEGVEVVVKEK